MPTLPYYVIPRWKGGRPILFLPDAPANPGHIVCYEKIGQHGEAAMEYYRSTRRARPAKTERLALRALIREYEGFLDKSEHIEIVRRDTKRFQKVRWSL